ncbi:wall-associated receptor kinase-like 1 [Eucalyptus grandis]|uniref:wall-associated receptor kinase-like 1 n=1 Tax=Eucalyptus grandis TaxID=71139 RepID=UPI00192EFBF3|nr:wall-associated receptor kinase-like 1 [Eucalyptus grandis]
MGNNSTFRYSRAKNYFVAGGCDNQALMVLDGNPGEVLGCKSSCDGGRHRTLGHYYCHSGTRGCCMTPITNNVGKYSVEFKSYEGKAIAPGGAKCRFAFLVEAAWWSRAHLNSLPLDVPVVLEWAITPDEEKLLSKRSNGHSNKNSVSCQTLKDSFHISCACNPGYEGNSFLPLGCQGVGTSVAAVVLSLLPWWSYEFIKRRRAAKLKQKFFKRNGGLILQQRLSSVEDNHTAKGKLFTSLELDMATDHFNENRILGHGAQGTVYKGMLTDGAIIAVKKSKVVDAEQVEQFVNEIVILSEINHRNVVKLLGFCLESEVPLLVYEFVPNGTLYQYLHNPCGGFPVPWEARLRIANEVAGALLYLHSIAAIPIYHRDIKSSNILLDEKYQAKVADFGASRSITIDQTHLTTKVQGTFGYLDPEYFRTSQFTDKSDVYSFGVVLVELLTGEKPISQSRAEEGRSLAMYFIISMEENCLFDVLDKEVLDQGKKEEIVIVSNLAKRCLNLNRRYRPTMKEVAMELEQVRSLENPVVAWQNDE